MSWAKFDDRYDDHPKLKRAWKENRATVGIHAMAITAACRHETDGVIDDLWLEEKLPAKKEREQVLGILVKLGLFEDLGDGNYAVHDFLTYNRSKQDAEEKRRKDRERKAAHGAKGGKRRGDSDEDVPATPAGVAPDAPRNPGGNAAESPPIPDGPQVDSDAIPRGIHSESQAPDPTRPDPTEVESVSAGGSASASALALGVDPLAVIEALPSSGGSRLWDQTWPLQRGDVLASLASLAPGDVPDRFKPLLPEHLPRVQRLVAEQLADNWRSWDSRNIRFAVMNSYVPQALGLIATEIGAAAGPPSATKAGRQSERDAEYAAAVEASPRKGGLFGAAALPADRRGVIDGEVIER